MGSHAAAGVDGAGRRIEKKGRRVQGKVAVVTGGASGIGLAVCRRFAAAGATVAIVDRDEARVQAAARELGATAWQADVGDPDRLAEVIEAAARKLGGLSILVNNAGEGRLAPLEAYRPSDWDRLVAVNARAVFVAMRAAAPWMRRSGGGVIVNNASASGDRPTRGELPYSAAKAAVVAMTKAAAQELAPEIRVNAVSPGVIRTAMTEPLLRSPELLEPVLEATPLGRVGEPEDVADVIFFLCSDASRFVTGQNLVVDGGLGLAQAGIDTVLRRLLARRRQPS